MRVAQTRSQIKKTVMYLKKMSRIDSILLIITYWKENKVEIPTYVDNSPQ